jgi:hypothetical protein
LKKGHIARVCGHRKKLKKEMVEEENNQFKNNVDVEPERVKQVNKLKCLVESYIKVFGEYFAKVKYLTGVEFYIPIKR